MAITPESGNSKQRGLFHDPEVGTEAHDDILAWVASRSGQEQIAEMLTITTYERWWETAIRDTDYPDHPDYIPVHNDERRYFVVPDATWKLLKQTSEVHLEYPLSARNGYIIGFADAVLTCTAKYEFDGFMRIKRPQWTGGYQSEIMLMEFFQKVTDTETTRLLIEVKTGRLQLGEVLRQLNTYASTGNFSHRLLIVKQRPPAHYVEALEGQGVSVALFSDYELEWLTAVNHARHA